MPPRWRFAAESGLQLEAGKEPQHAAGPRRYWRTAARSRTARLHRQGHNPVVQGDLLRSRLVVGYGSQTLGGHASSKIAQILEGSLLGCRHLFVRPLRTVTDRPHPLSEMSALGRVAITASRDGTVQETVPAPTYAQRTRSCRPGCVASPPGTRTLMRSRSGSV